MEAAGGVHVLFQLNPPAVEGIVHHLASTMMVGRYNSRVQRIPEILRLRQVCVGFQASVQVKKITMEYSREVRGHICRGPLSIFNLPDEIFLPRIIVHNSNNRRALQKLLGLQPYMTVVLTNPTGSARIADEQRYPRGLGNLWYPPPTFEKTLGVWSWVQHSEGIQMAQLLTEVGEQPVVLKCMMSSQLFWCDKCKKWDDDPCGAVAKHRAKVECGSS